MKRNLILLLASPFGLACLQASPAQLRFEPHPSGRAFIAWNPDYRLAVSSGGYELRLAGPEPRIVRAAIAGARAGAAPQPSGEVAVHTQYLRGGERRLVRTAFQTVRYADVLPGIDVVYYGRNGALEFDFVVKPGADPKSIRLQYRGHDRLEIDDAGDLVLHAAGARIVQHTPAVYQEVEGARRLVSGSYALARDGQVRFVLGRYDRKHPLVIDPVVTYFSLAGGTRPDAAAALAYGRDGFLYMAGTTFSTDFPNVGSPAQPTNGGDLDVFVMKIDPNAPFDSSVVYMTFLGGSGRDELTAMTVGPDNAVYLTGITSSSNFPVSSGARQSALSGTTDAFVVKLNPALDGSSGLIYSTYLGGSGADGGGAITVDSRSNALVTGGTGSTDFPAVGAPLPESNGGGGDAFVARFDPSGFLTHSAYLGGEGWETGRAIATDNADLVVVAGRTTSFFFPLAPDTSQTGAAGRGDLFVARIRAGGDGFVLEWSAYLGGSDLEDVKEVALLSDGRMVLAGYTFSPDFPVTANAYQLGYRGNVDAFVSVIDPAALGSSTVAYSTLFGGAGADVPYSLLVNADGTFTLAGYTLSSDFPVAGDAMQTTFQGGGADGFVATLNPAADPAESLLYSTYLGGPATDVVYAVASTDGGALTIAGTTSSGRFPAGTPNEVTRTAGVSDAFVILVRPE